jgi:hypothetical protein
MTTIQIAALIAGGLIILSYFIDLKRVLEIIKMPVEGHIVKGKESTILQGDEIVIGHIDPKGDLGVAGPEGVPQVSLANIVAQWESLKKQCEQNGLTEAVNKLEEVFPLFVKKA